MKNRYLSVGLTVGLLFIALVIWWPRDPALPPPPELRNAPQDGFGLGVQGHTNDARGNKLVICFFANPKDYGMWLTPVRIERRVGETGEWKRFPFPEARRWKAGPGHTENFYLKPPDGRSPWRVVFECSRVMTLGEKLEQGIQAGSGGSAAANMKFETRTPDLIGVNFAPAYSSEPKPDSPSDSKAE